MFYTSLYILFLKSKEGIQTNNKRATKEGLCITDAGNAFKLASESICKDVVQYHLYAEHKTQRQ